MYNLLRSETQAPDENVEQTETFTFLITVNKRFEASDPDFWKQLDELYKMYNTRFFEKKFKFTKSFRLPVCCVVPRQDESNG